MILQKLYTKIKNIEKYILHRSIYLYNEKHQNTEIQK